MSLDQAVEIALEMMWDPSGAHCKYSAKERVEAEQTLCNFLHLLTAPGKD